MDNETGNDTKNTPVQQAENADSTQAQNGNETVVRSRRRLTGATLAAPIVMSLTSRSVWGGAMSGQDALCLSAQMSGDLSHPHRLECTYGWSPGAWKNPGGTINGMRTLDAWVAAAGPGAYGTLPAGKKDKCKHYTGGMLFSQAFLGAPLSGDNLPIREILCEESGSREFHAIAALLNANLPMFDYVLTPTQVINLYFQLPPDHPDLLGGQNFNDFMDATWDGPDP